MAIPRRPERSNPIPNQPFDSPEVTSVKGPYWDMALGSGLEPDPYGSVQTSGSTPSEPSAYLYGPSGFVGVGSGLQVGENGELEQSGGGYIYCTPAYPELPPSGPPYGCNTVVNTAGVTDFSGAWYGCGFTEFPCVDTSSGTSFSYTWGFNTYLTSFPSIDTGLGGNFYRCWIHNHSLSSFPRIDTHSATSFSTTWDSCVSLVHFPSNMFDYCPATDFFLAWTTCALSQQSVNNILVSLDAAGQINGIVNIHGGTSSPPSEAGLTAKVSLQAKGWTVTTN